MQKINFKNIRLKNVRSHYDFELPFKNNELKAIVGRNGSGKSSIFQSLMMGLYGDSGEPKVKIADMVNKKKKKNLEIIIDFDIIENDKVDCYRIEKYHSHSKMRNKTLLFKNEKDISAKTVTDTHKLIERIVTPKQIFKNTVYFAQHVNDFFTSLTDAEQKNIFDSIMNLNDWKIRYDEADKKLKILKDNLLYEENYLNLDSRSLEEKNSFLIQLNELKKNEIEKEKLQIETITLNITKINNNICKIEDNISNIKYSETKHQQLQNKLFELNNELTNIQTQLEEQNNRINLESKQFIDNLKIKSQQKFSEMKVKIDNKYYEHKTKVDDRIKSILNNINEIKSDPKLDLLINEKRKKLELLQTDKNTITALLTNIKSKGEGIAKSHKELKDDIIHLTTEIDKISKDNSICPTCLQILNKDSKEEAKKNYKEKLINSNKIYEEQDGELTELRSQFKTNKTKLDDINEQINDVELMYSSKISVCESQIRKNVSEIEEEKKVLENKLTAAKQTVDDNITKVKDKIEKDLLQNINEQNINVGSLLEKNTAENKQHKEIINKKIIDLEVDLKEINSIKEKHTNSTLLLHKLNNELENQQNNLKDIKNNKYDNTQILQLEDEIKTIGLSINKYKKTIRDIEYNIKITNFWKEAFSDRGIKSMLIDESIPFLNKKIREELEKIMPGKFIVSFDTLSTTKSGDIRDKFSVNILNTTNGADSHSLLSGGEKRIIDVCIMQALRSLSDNLYGKEINLILLDEVLDSLDYENSAIFCRTLKKLAVGNSVNIITHLLNVDMECDDIYQL